MQNGAVHDSALRAANVAAGGCRQDPFGSPGWDSIAAMQEWTSRQAADRAAREEAAIRAALTERVKTALINTVDHGEFGDASGHLGGDGFDAMAAAAVDALEQFYNDGRKAMQ